MAGEEVYLAYNNRVSKATLFGGDYVSSMPLSNLKDSELNVKARTNGLALGATKMVIQMPKDNPVRVLALANHNLGLSARHRVRYHSEAPITNMLSYSWNFQQWLNNNLNVLLGYTSPDGGTKMSLQRRSSSGISYSNWTFGYLPPELRIFSMYVKKATAGNQYALRIQGIYPEMVDAIFDLNTKTVRAANGNGGGVLHSAGVVDCSSIMPGLMRIWVAGTCGLTACVAGPVSADLPPIFWEGGSSVWSDAYTFGAMLTTGSTLTSYYETNGAPATRPLGYFDSWQPYDYDSGWKDVWPAVYNTADLDWQDLNWWSGRYLEEERSGYVWTLPHILPKKARPLFFSWEFDDPENTNGYVEYGRLFLADGWQPAVNMDFGASLLWETNTEVDEALSGAEVFDARDPYRVARFRTTNMDEDEALSKAFEIMRRSGIHNEVFFMWDPTDTVHALRRQFLGRLRTLNAIEFPQAYINGKQLAATGWEVKERVP